MFTMLAVSVAPTAYSFLNTHSNNSEGEADREPTEEHIAGALPFGSKSGVIPPSLISGILPIYYMLRNYNST